MKNDKKNSQLTSQERKDLKVLALFTSVYCRVHHLGDKRPLAPQEPAFASLGCQKYPLCEACREFLHYAMLRRLYCPVDPKPLCKHCTVHCYRAGHREKVREIMKFSGKYLIMRGRLDLLWHYFF